MKAVRRQPENHVARFDAASIDDRSAIDHADDAAGQIIFAFAIHAGHLRGFAADERTTGRATGASEAAQELIEDGRL